MRTVTTFFAVAAFVAVGLSAAAQEGAADFTCGVPVQHAGAALYPMPYAGLWGYVDAGGAWVIAPSFERAGDFSEGRAIVARHDGFWGVIDESGAWVHEPAFEAQSYAYLGERRVHTPPLEAYSEGCSAGVGATSSDPPFFLDRAGVTHWRYDPPAALADEEVLRYGSFSEGKAWFLVFTMDLGGDHGWVDAQGDIILPAVYGFAGDFVGGLAPARSPEQYAAFIDLSGEPALPSKWTLYDAQAFAGGLALVRTGPFDFMYLRPDGSVAFKEVTDPTTGEQLRISAGGAFSDGLVALEVESDDAVRLLYVTADGQVAFDPEATTGTHVCSGPDTPGFGQFRHGLARLMTVTDPAACQDVLLWAELADYAGVEYVYIDHSGEVVLRASELAAPPEVE